MPNIITKPDKSVGLEEVRERFEMPYSATFSPIFPAMLEKEAKSAAKRASEVYSRLRKWHWRSDLGVTVDKSELQIPLRDFGTTNPDFTAAVDQNTILNLKYDSVAFVVIMWFEVPRQQVTIYDNNELNDADGFVEEMPEDREIIPV